MRRSYLFSFFSLLNTYSCCILNDALVFDPHFYLNTNPDLEHANLHSEQEAANHWCSNGVHEGRQATSSFHSVQYLRNYPELQDIYGDDYEAATKHFLEHGAEEGRLGYVEGGAHGRWTVKSPKKLNGSFFHLSSSERTAGAVDSLSWRGKEFINNWDHGRQFQVAMTVQNYGECWNPTEAGGRSDGIGRETKSILTSVHASENILMTSVLPAYWIRGDDQAVIPAGSNCPAGHDSYNSEDTHPYETSKIVTMGCFGLDNCINFTISSNIGNSPDMPQSNGFAQLEAPTAYLNSEFKDVSYLNPTTGELKEGDSNEKNDLVIIHTEDREFALGVVSEPRPPTTAGIPGLKYHYSAHGNNFFDRSTYKWSVVVREDFKPDWVFNVASYICAGTLDMVVECLITAKNGINAI